MGNPLLFIVRLWLNSSDIAAFEEFERNAARIMAQHGGRIERAIRITADNDPDAPFEIHIVSFPDHAAFESYRNDPETQALAGVRAQLIARTELFFGADATSYLRQPLIPSGNDL
jgi:uncharacterized protein (DUF1330 family)